MKSTENTRIYKSFNNGWIAETTEQKGGKDWQITTMKRFNGKITSCAQAGKAGNGEEVRTFSFALFGGDKNVTLISETGKSTEKAIREQHTKALILFDENKEIQEIAAKEVYQIQEGQVIWFIGQGMNSEYDSRAVVYLIEKGRYGTYYHTVNLKTLKLSRVERIRDIEEKFGIGYYYKKGDVIGEDQLNDLVISAKELEAKESRKNEAEMLLNTAARQAKIEEGRNLVNIPKDAESIIVANLKQNESDPMTDYYGCSTIKTVYLAFSSHKRNLFPEMRKAAKNCPETAFLADVPKEWEEKQNYSGGAGYFLGENRYSGWNISKISYIDLASEAEKEKLYKAAAEGRYFANIQEEKAEARQAEEVAGDINILEYSEKAIVVFGDTKPIKDTLKGLGGRFNFRLTHPKTGNKLAGWIFSKAKTQEVKNSLKLW